MKASDVIKMFEKAKFLGRHGDVVLVKAVRCKTEGKPTPVLAEGELTGHAHRVDGATAKRIAGQTVQRLLSVAKNAVAKVDHEEHKAQPIPAGTHRIGIQAQWTPEGLKRVVD